MRHGEILNILEAFGVSARSIEKPEDAKLASVYIADGRHVLRSRDLEEDTADRFDADVSDS